MSIEEHVVMQQLQERVARLELSMAQVMQAIMALTEGGENNAVIEGSDIPVAKNGKGKKTHR